MPRKGQMSDQDAADELIRNAAVYYNVVLYVPQSNSRVSFSTPDLAKAVKYAEGVYLEDRDVMPRAAMVYAVDNRARFALMGTTNRHEQTFKANMVKIY